MCAAAVVWAGIGYVGYGYGIKDAIGQGRRRIELSCNELFQKAGAEIQIEEGLCRTDCAPLYDRDVRTEVRKLRNASADQLKAHNEETMKKRIRWFKEKVGRIETSERDLVRTGYDLLLKKLGITEEEAPVFQRSEREIVFHSANMCPTLEACKILRMDTRQVCKLYNEGATEALLQQIDERLSFTRNYEKLRPSTDYCEEIVRLRDGA